MRVLRNIASSHSLFANSIEQLTKGDDNKYHLKLINMNSDNSDNLSSLTPSKVLDDIYNFTLKIQSANSVNKVLNLFNIEIKKLKFCFDPEIFLFNPDTSECFPLNLECSSQRTNFIRNGLNHGIIDWIGESKSPKILPYNSTEVNNTQRVNCLIVPLINDEKFIGVSSLLTLMSSINQESIEFKALTLYIETAINKIQYELQRNELIKTYSDLQTTQSKLSNDFKLAALGELSYRSIEEIASPLQVILSYAEILKNEYPEIDETVITTIKKQVLNIRDILNRLSKFTEVNENNKRVQSCSLNEAITEFHQLVEPTLNGDAYECILDLEENIPPILSNPVLLKQLLINSFSLINPLNKKGGGIIISTRYSNETIFMKMLFTDHIESVHTNERAVGIKLIKNIMQKHEGDFSLKTSAQTGSTLIFNFPLKRKIRK